MWSTRGRARAVWSRSPLASMDRCQWGCAMADPIRVLIADDHPIFRHGLRRIVETDPQLVVVAEAGNGDEALRAMQDEQPAVAVLDLTMPGKDGFEVARAVREAGL